MEATSQCIGPHEPAFVASFVAGVGFAVFLASVLVRLERRLQGKRMAFVYRSLAWGAAEIVAFVAPIAFAAVLDRWAHPERTLCTSLVWRWYFVPPVVLVVTGVTWGVLDAFAQRRAPRQS